MLYEPLRVIFSQDCPNSAGPPCIASESCGTHNFNIMWPVLPGSCSENLATLTFTQPQPVILILSFLHVNLLPHRYQQTAAGSPNNDVHSPIASQSCGALNVMWLEDVGKKLPTLNFSLSKPVILIFFLLTPIYYRTDISILCHSINTHIWLLRTAMDPPL